MKLKNVDVDKYKYNGYGIGFDSRSEYSLPDVTLGKYIIIFGADISSSLHVDNKGKYISILGKGPAQRLHKQNILLILHNQGKYLY